ncbi:hypothetical protein DIPPA_23701 [Diplonema papillatum]|nr:hypothetical protein DIPPA_23701 [Diplonema papillatum]|eukprot:gene8019-12338_t
MARATGMLIVLIAAFAAAVPENDIYFDSNGTSVVSYALDHYSITPKEKWEGLTWSGDHLVIKADRKQSGEVSADFVNGLTFANVLATEKGLDQLPHELHFAIFGNITFNLNGTTATCEDFRVAQGHTDVSHNNWWMGGSRCAAVPTTAKMVCRCNGTSLEFHSLDKSDHMYVILGN